MRRQLEMFESMQVSDREAEDWNKTCFSPLVRHNSPTSFSLPSCLQAGLGQRCKKLHNACEAFSSHHLAGIKGEQEEKQAPEEAQSAAPEKTALTSASAQQLSKPAKKAGKKK